MNKIVLYESKPSLLRKKDFIKYLNQISFFYQINKKFRRHIQVQRYEAVLKKAQIQKDTQLELDTLKQIDKLYNLQNENDPEEVTKKRLPRRKRSTNPEVFTQDD